MSAEEEREPDDEPTDCEPEGRGPYRMGHRRAGQRWVLGGSEPDGSHRDTTGNSGP